MLQLVALASASWAPSCPPVSTFGNKLNLTAFTEHTWHIQEQQLTGYRARNKAMTRHPHARPLACSDCRGGQSRWTARFA